METVNVSSNGIYILATQGDVVTYKEGHELCTRHKTEYRVTHAQAIENIYGELLPDDRWTLNPDYVCRLFGERRVFTDRKITEGYAIYLLDWIGEDTVLHGIQFLDFRHVRLPKALTAAA